MFRKRLAFTLSIRPVGRRKRWHNFGPVAPAPVRFSKGQHQKPLYNAICRKNQLNCVINSSEQRYTAAKKFQARAEIAKNFNDNNSAVCRGIGISY